MLRVRLTRRVFDSAFVCCAFAFFVPPPMAAASDFYKIDARGITSAVSAVAADTKLRTIANPTQRALDGTLAQTVQRQCGDLRGDLLESARNLSAEHADPSIAVIPPCVFWREKATFPLPPGGAPERVYKTWSGTFDSNTFLRLNADLPDAKRLAVATPITVKNVSRQTTFELKDNVDPSDVPALFVGTGIQNTQVSNIVKGTLLKTLSATEFGCSSTAPIEPFDPAVVRRILSDHRNSPPKQAAIVVVTDTAYLANLETRFPLTEFRDTQSHNSLGVFGTSFAFGGTSIIFQSVDKMDDRSHAIAVGSIASGLRVFDTAASASTWLHIRFDQVVAPYGNDFIVLPTDIALSLKLSRNQPYLSTPGNFAIVNWSWKAETDQLDAVRDELLAGPELIVAAAGNDGLDLATISGTTRMFPAKFGNVTPTNLIVVGAVDGDLKTRPVKSNYGPDYVHIGALGCQVPVLNESGNWKAGDGTSFAAPLVSFTATLLHSMSVIPASSIKTRILMTADEIPSLSGDFQSGRVLNVTNALSIHDDIIGRIDGTQCVGKLESAWSVVNKVGQKLDASAVRRLSRVYGNWVAWQEDISGQPARSEVGRTADVKPQFGAAAILRLADGTTCESKVDDIAYLIPHQPDK